MSEDPKRHYTLDLGKNPAYSEYLQENDEVISSTEYGRDSFDIVQVIPTKNPTEGYGIHVVMKEWSTKPSIRRDYQGQRLVYGPNTQHELTIRGSIWGND